MTGLLRRGVVFLARTWYYFRVGYGTYLTFIPGVINMLILVWVFVVREVPGVEAVLVSPLVFCILAASVAGSVGACMGWLHFKVMPTYRSEIEIGIESNPYFWKLPRGYQPLVWFPAILLTLQQVRKIREADPTFTAEERCQVLEIERRLEVLIEEKDLRRHL